MNNVIHIKFYLFGILMFTLFGSSCQTVKNPGQGKPNIVFILCDDLTRQAISAYGGIYKDIAPTPNMDKLAAEGMIFHDVVCSNSICGPSRASILTGNHSNVNGYYKNEGGGRFDSTQWTFPREFQKNGYQTALFGKWHLGSEPVGFDYFKYHDNSSQQGTYWDPVYNLNGKRIQEKGYATNSTTNSALAWLDQTREKSKPFLLLLQYKAPHRPWDPDKKYEKLWENIEMPYPSTFDDNYKGREKTAGDTEMTMEYLTNRDMKLPMPPGLEGKEKTAWEFYGANKDEIVQLPGMTFEQGRRWRYQTYIKDYLATVRSIDDNLGLVLEYLKKNGLEKNTIIVFTSDQGFFLGDHGFFDKRFIYEESLIMPFIMKYPDQIRKASENHAVISNIDIAPTLLDLAGIQPSHKMQGKSFRPTLNGSIPNDWRQSAYYHYYEFPFWHHVFPHYGIRTDQYTLAHFYYKMDVWELYDLKADPDQLHNVIYNPEYADIAKKLKAELKNLQIIYGNDRPFEEYNKITDTDFGFISNQNEKIEDIIKN